MKIIPTPYSFEKSNNTSELTGFRVVMCEIVPDSTVRFGLDELEKKFAVPCICGGSLKLVKADDKFFEEKNASEQGYILTRKADEILLKAQSSVGFMYGLMTLLQLYGDAPAEFEIKDKPAVKLRGNMNTLWAESGVWTYDFGDGLEAAGKRLREALDEAAKAKLNLMYIDAFGFKDDRFPGYNKFMKEISDYANVRGVHTMCGGYGMGYGQSAHSLFMGKVFRNRYPYPDGELYDCIGTCEHDETAPPEHMKGRSYGTCLSNTALTDDKIKEMRTYLLATGITVIYLHHMDSDQIHEPLWLGRCKHCREKYPNDSLYAKDGCAGAFAEFYDRILDALLPEIPDLVICPVSPGYAYAETTSDYAFEKCTKFWASVLEYAKNRDALIPTFRELLLQHDEEKLRFDILGERLASCGCVFFSSGDGFYSDKIYTPSAAYIKVMNTADMMICANGGAIQKLTQYTNAEYMWNPENSAFYNIEVLDNFRDMMNHYDALREGYSGWQFNEDGPKRSERSVCVERAVRPDGIYGDGGLVETSCAVLFGEKYAKRIADVFRIRGKNGECPIFTLCNNELSTDRRKLNFRMLWDTPMSSELQLLYRERFAECTITTLTAKDMLDDILEEDDLTESVREHLEYLRDSAALSARFCSQLTRYMDLYIEADAYFENGTEITGDFYARAEGLIRDGERALAKVTAAALKPFDVMGGINVWRDKCFDFIAYSAGQIVKSLKTNSRIPEDKRELEKRNWW